MNNPITLNLADGGLGKGKDGIDGLHVKIGVAELGTENILYPIANDKEALSRFGKGSPLAESLARHFKEGGIRCFGIRPTNDVACSNGTVVHTGTGTAAGVPGGTPAGSRNFVIEIILGGEPATATYRWSQDGGITWSSVYITPASGTAINLACGVTITFTGTGSGAFVAGDKYSFASTGPSASAANFLLAIDAVREQFNPTNMPYRFNHIVGGFDRTFWESVASKAEDFETARIFEYFVLEYPTKTTGTDLEYIQDIIDEGRLFFSKHAAIVGARLRYGDDVDFKSAAILLCAQLSAHRVNIHPGWVQECASKTAKEIQFWDTLKDYVESMDLSNIIIACQYENWDGIYIKKDHLMSPADSDFQTIHDLRPANKIRFLAYAKIMPFVNSQNNPAEGDNAGIISLISELDTEISQQMEKQGEMEIAGHEVEIDPKQDLSGGELKGKIHAYKTDTMEKFTIDVGYSIKE